MPVMRSDPAVSFAAPPWNPCNVKLRSKRICDMRSFDDAARNRYLAAGGEKALAVLEIAGIVRSERLGRSRLCYLRTETLSGARAWVVKFDDMEDP